MQMSASTHRLRPIRIPFVPRTARERLRGRYDTPDEQRAQGLLAAVAPTAHKLKRRSRSALRAAIAILKADPVEPHQIADILRSLPDTPHLSLVRSGHVGDAALWQDARETIEMDLRGYACAGADGQLGTCLAVIDALLSMPEDERRRRWAA